MPTLPPLATLKADVESPFALEQPQAYLRWRERKLARYPQSAGELVVELRDPRNPSDAEIGELRRVCRAANMAVYAGPAASAADREIPLGIGARLGLARLQANALADGDGVTSLEVAPEKSARGYIPYSNRRLLWHTDGYYNAPQARIGAFILHCARPAATGGENRLLDPEIAYILLRDTDPAHIRALSAADTMTIPANTEPGAPVRPASCGPVFTVVEGVLHMRYTARTRSVEWRNDAATLAAAGFLHRLLEADSTPAFSVRLAAGQGLVCNNVLHNRNAFADSEPPGAGRLVYRARYLDRVAA